MSTQDKELEAYERLKGGKIDLPWVYAFGERLSLCLMKMKNGTDITEDDYNLLEVLHKKVYSGGDYIITRKTLTIQRDNPVQNGLFDTKITDPYDDLAQ